MNNADHGYIVSTSMRASERACVRRACMRASEHARSRACVRACVHGFTRVSIIIIYLYIL